ncbi:MAG: hypothetical protein A2Z42_04245 [Candidatus Woykebacteria bacterium RBG_19FT_COMBO_43_10]|uniref:Uncharacterized protein n=1 Tax=Candidatus Woykebacteria bacterium RBG_19FT_COMBO_43_10 TaxID=1802598 RepID=A0A1G1WJL8_9BACT|nr:MAG: hypothetical protein A2Z42_04245 [Candidatus Woykebacteria bacterium RBG_19FT_COMBO_43_10]
MISPTHPHDIVEVCNIDIDCDEVTEEILADSKTTVNEAGKPRTDYFETVTRFNHAEGFAVKYGGQTFRIPPGETRLYPWYIAEHYAKYLADHILRKREDKESKKGLINSPVERPATLEQILLRIVQPFAEDSPLTEGQKAVQMVEELNEGERVVDAGYIPSKAVGNLKPEPKTLDEILENVPDEAEPEGETSIYDEKKPLPSWKTLATECEKLDIPITGKETKDQLASKLRAFSK